MTATNETKRKRVNLVRNVTWDMCAGLPNVQLNSTLPPPETTTAVAVAMEILYNAAVEHRDWTFKVLSLSHITISAGDEKLATITRQYSPRARANIPYLNAHRIPGVKRSGVFSNKEAAPILRKIREYVYPLTMDETIADSTKHVSQRLGSLVYAAIRTVDSTKQAMNAAALAFALDPSVREQFLKYEALYGAVAMRNTPKALSDHEQAVADKALLDAMQKQAGRVYPLVARTDNGWYIKHKEVTSSYPDESLPPEYANVHILKLTENDTLLPDIGIKLDAKTFIVIPTENS